MRRIAAALLLTITSSAAVQASCSKTKVVIGAAAVPQASQEWLANELRVAADKVCAWWGPTFSSTLQVEIEAADNPSMALIPAWRGEAGRMRFAGPTTERRRAATIHEVVHVFAPNGNRFLAEGLAVYAHERLGGPSAYPNFGRPLHAAARAPAQTADIPALDRLATPDMLGGRDPYLVAGSFVRFLIERSGLETFRKLYALTPLLPRQRNAGEPARWSEIYSVPLERLATEWRNRLTSSR